MRARVGCSAVFYEEIRPTTRPGPPALATGCISGCKTTCPRAGHGVHHHQSSVGLWVQNNLRALGNEIATRRARELFSVWCGTANAERGPWYVGYYSGVLANG